MLKKRLTSNNRILKTMGKHGRFLFANLPVAMGIASLDGRILHANKRMLRLTGYSMQEIKKLKLAKTYQDSKERAVLLKKIKKDGLARDFPAGLKRKNGALYWVKLNVLPFVLNNKKVLLTVAEDITEKRNIAKDLAVKNDAIESSINAIVLLDPHCRVVYVNPAFLKMWGYQQKSEVVGCSAYKFWRPEKQKEKEIGAVIFKKGGWLGELTAARKDGSHFDIELCLSMVKDEKGKPVCLMGSLIDISGRKQIEKAKDEFVSLASHQLRTPLTAISWYTEILLDEDGLENGWEQKEFLTKIYQSSQRLVGLVNAFLNVSRIDLGVFAIEPAVVDLRKIAQSAAEEFSAQIAKKKLRLSKYFRGELGAVKLDSELIRIVLENLLSNAVKYSKKGGRIVFSISRSSSRLLIRVADQGWGIPQAQQAKIFDKLFRADNVRDKEVDGCGLGLYIVRAIVQASGGRISFKSEESKGTVFNVIFPKAGMRFRHGIKSLISGQAV